MSFTRKRLGLDISMVLHEAQRRWGKYELMDALKLHFSDLCFPGDHYISQELEKMSNRTAYVPLRNLYTTLIENVMYDWLKKGRMTPDPQWWIRTVAPYH